MMCHFVLVHGSSHGAWCWYKLTCLLKSVGHLVTALDLGASGIDSRRLDEIGGVWDYLQPLLTFLSSLPEDEKVVLVGHSYGGLSIAMAMERFPEKILAGIFVAAFMPAPESAPGLVIQEYLTRVPEDFFMDSTIKIEESPVKASSQLDFGPEFTRTKLYAGSSLEDVELAEKLLRSTELFVNELKDGSLLSKEKYGGVRKVYVVCEQDAALTQEFQRWMISVYPPDDVLFLPDAGHMCMLSHPQQLLAHLLRSVPPCYQRPIIGSKI